MLFPLGRHMSCLPGAAAGGLRPPAGSRAQPGCRPVLRPLAAKRRRPPRRPAHRRPSGKKPPVGRLAGCRKGSIPPRLRGSMAPLRRGAMGDDPGLQRGCGFAPRSPGSLGSPDPPDQGCIPGPQGDPDRFRAAPLGRLPACRKTSGEWKIAALLGFNRIWRHVRQIRKKPCVARVSLHSSLAAP